jgi:hypothetical protein
MANITLQIEIPENWVSRVQESFNGMANNKIEMQFERVNHDFEYPEKQNGESQVQFAERILRELAKSLIKIYELDKDFKERYIPAVNAIEQPNINVPNDILI